MVNEQKYWISKAHKYAGCHPSILSVTDPEQNKNRRYTFTAIFKVNLPGRFDLIGETKNGVRINEPVEFVFPTSFPYKAPQIFLRDDFPRDFPHIYPSQERVKPCVFDGSLADLLQQPKWFDGILDQISDWLEKAAANILINLKQGWEPMRLDDTHGLIFYNMQQLQATLQNSPEPLLLQSTFAQPLDDCIVAGMNVNEEPLEKKDVTKLCVFSTKPGYEIKRYMPNYIKTFADLSQFAAESKVEMFKDTIDEEVEELKKYGKKYLFVLIGVKRPLQIINTNYEIELMNFVIHLKYNKKNGKIHPKSQVKILMHYNLCNPNLLQMFSGTSKLNDKTIIQIGAGSLGSKICLHLARNGNNDFVIIDNDNFTPHNNARHALVGRGLFQNKAVLLRDSINIMHSNAGARKEDIFKVLPKLKGNFLFIDSTANLSTRNLLARIELPGSIIHTSLYHNGFLSLIAAEAAERNPRIDDLMVTIYSKCLREREFGEKFLSEQSVYLSTGMGCGSYTTIAPDSRISLSAAGMASRIQNYLSSGLPANGEIFLGNIDTFDMAISWQQIDCGQVLILPASGENDWEVRILQKVCSEMKAASKNEAPNETGGALIGHISLVNKTITISDLIPPPEDSIRKPSYFLLGKKGLRKKVKDIEKKTNGLLTYVGTWHSHPPGGGALGIDHSTKRRIIVLREYEPTVCLIWTPERIIRV